jgi:hypothetical protein
MAVPAGMVVPAAPVITALPEFQLPLTVGQVATVVPEARAELAVRPVFWLAMAAPAVGEAPAVPAVTAVRE